MSYTLLIHGGAGNISAKKMSAGDQASYKEALGAALAAGSEILKNNGSALDAVEAAVMVLENSPLFNAGKGAVFAADGTQEMDACIMEGVTRKAGAVASVKHMKNPIQAARLVMEKTSHVMLTGGSAEQHLRKLGAEWAEADYFFDQHRWDQLQEIRGTEKLQLDFAEDKPEPDKCRADSAPDKCRADSAPDKYGTVGAVACDKAGNVAAATSTGGLTNKLPGRIGDTPIIGAGCYADNATCAVSCTGQGEFFMRGLIAADVAMRMCYQDAALECAAKAAIGSTLKQLGGTGGLIAVDAKGNYTMPFNTTGMFRGVVKEGRALQIEMFR